jgi:hypothetical protein
MSSTTREDRVEDPLVDEVRQRRVQLLGSFDNQLEKLCAELVRRQAEHSERIVDLRRDHARTGQQ